MRTYKYDVDDLIEDGKRKLKILQRTKLWNNGYISAYKVRCLNCGYEWTTRQTALQNGAGCNCCRNKIVVDGINSIADTDEWMVPWFVNQEEAHRYSYGSSEHIMAKCPQCGYSKRVRIDTLYKAHGFKCPVCSGGKSYPQRFVIQLFIETGVNFINELTKQIAPWIRGKRRYDFYLPNHNGIVQINGAQHLDPKVQKVDIQKKQSAIKDGKIAHYITIDCRKSQPQFIKNQIIGSGLLQLIEADPNSIPWERIQENAQKSLVKQVCNYYQNNEVTMQEVGKRFHLSVPCIFTYVKTGKNLGWVTRIYKTKPKSLDNGDPLSYFAYDPDYRLVATGVTCDDIASVLNKKYEFHFTDDNVSHVKNRWERTVMGFHIFDHELSDQQIKNHYNETYKGWKLPFNCYRNGVPICMNMSTAQIKRFIQDNYNIHVNSADIIQVATGIGVSSKGFYFEYAYKRLRDLLNKKKEG